MLARALTELRVLLGDRGTDLLSMVARRRAPCAACALSIEPGEVITYERTVGARHMACADREGTRRRNLYVTACDLCDARLGTRSR